MEYDKILAILSCQYPISFTHLEIFRNCGSTSYIVHSKRHKYFLKISKPAFGDTIRSSVCVNVFLQNNNFPVPNVVFTVAGLPYVEIETEIGLRYYILYDYFEGSEIDVEHDAEEIGFWLGRLHQIMNKYQGFLATHEREFYICRYINILKKKSYPRVDIYEEYGDALWSKVRDLPRGFSHGDMYSGNIQRSQNGRLYFLDFDTSCIGFAMYDLALICNRTDYFKFHKDGYQKTAKVYERMLPEYLKNNPLPANNVNSLFDMIGLYHFALQATVIEFMGLECVDHDFFDRQLDWLLQWKALCET